MRFNRFRHVIAVLAVAIGLFLIAIPIWVFRDVTDATRRVLLGSGMAAVLIGVGVLGLTILMEGVLLLRKKKDRVVPSDDERTATIKREPTDR